MTTQSLSVESQNIGDQVKEGGEGVVMLTVHGPLDSHTYGALESKLDRLINHGDAKIIIDLAGVDYVSTAGLRVFLAARAKARHGNSGLVLLRPSQPVELIVRTLQIQECLNIASDLPAAMNMLSN